MKVASRIGGLRHHRDALLGPASGETAWDLLLAIYAHGGSDGGVRVRDLVAASRHHSATTIRTVMMLEETGRIVLSSMADRVGTRIMTLAPPTAAALEAFLQDARAL